MATPRSCPKCRTEALGAEMIKDIEIDRCPVCKGIFLDANELQQILTNGLGTTADTLAFSPLSDAMDEVSGHCGDCDQPMRAVMTHNIRLDQCTGCGALFLDQGELASLQLSVG